MCEIKVGKGRHHTQAPYGKPIDFGYQWDVETLEKVQWYGLVFPLYVTINMKSKDAREITKEKFHVSCYPCNESWHFASFRECRDFARKHLAEGFERYRNRPVKDCEKKYAILRID